MLISPLSGRVGFSTLLLARFCGVCYNLSSIPFVLWLSTPKNLPDGNSSILPASSSLTWALYIFGECVSFSTLSSELFLVWDCTLLLAISSPSIMSCMRGRKHLAIMGLSIGLLLTLVTTMSTMTLRILVASISPTYAGLLLSITMLFLTIIHGLRSFMTTLLMTAFRHTRELSVWQWKRQKLMRWGLEEVSWNESGAVIVPSRLKRLGLCCKIDICFKLVKLEKSILFVLRCRRMKLPCSIILLSKYSDFFYQTDRPHERHHHSYEHLLIPSGQNLPPHNKTPKILTQNKHWGHRNQPPFV